jgi:hypothetical protein
MKNINNFLKWLVWGTILLSCNKEESTPPSNLPLKANKYEGDYKPKDFRLRKIKSTISYPVGAFMINQVSTYELIYNNRGAVERINVVNASGWEYYFKVFFKGARMDSISGNSAVGSGPHLSGMTYKGDNIIEFLFHTAQLDKISLKYDKKGRLINTPYGFPIIYDEDGFLSKIIYPIELYTIEFKYEKTQNPLFFENSHVLLYSTELMDLCYSEWNISQKKQAGEIITHRNTYDEIGRLIRKNYREQTREYIIEFAYY